MYAIIVYDVNVERVAKICQFLRKHLNWVQNSVFEGEVTKAELVKIENELRKLINEQTDSIQIYTMLNKNIIKKKHIGIKKSETSNII